MVFLSFLPFGYLLMNAESSFKKAKVKELSSQRRERLDKEYNVNRENMTEDFEKLDKFYRYTEKKEIQKFN